MARGVPKSKDVEMLRSCNGVLYQYDQQIFLHYCRSIMTLAPFPAFFCTFSDLSGCQSMSDISRDHEQKWYTKHTYLFDSSASDRASLCLLPRNRGRVCR